MKYLEKRVRTLEAELVAVTAWFDALEAPTPQDRARLHYARAQCMAAVQDWNEAEVDVDAGFLAAV